MQKMKKLQKQQRKTVKKARNAENKYEILAKNEKTFLACKKTVALLV